MARHSPVLVLVAWTCALWGASFMVLFLLNGRRDEAAAAAPAAAGAALAQRSLADSVEAPAACGHLAVTASLVTAGLYSGLHVFIRPDGGGGSSGASLLPLPARLWAHLTAPWLLIALARDAARLGVPYALAVASAGRMQTVAYGRFPPSSPQRLDAALWGRQVEGRYDESLAPWVWPLALRLRFTLVLYFGVYALVFTARLLAALLESASHATTWASASMAGGNAELPARRTARPGQRVSWADVRADVHLARATFVRGLPPIAPALRAASLWPRAGLQPVLLLLMAAVFAGGVRWRLQMAPVLNANSVFYSPAAVSSPFYDALFTAPWAHAPSFVAGAVAAVALASAPPVDADKAMQVHLRVLVAGAAALVLLLGSYDMTVWIVLLPESARRAALAAYLPLYASALALVLGLTLRSATVTRLLLSGRVGSLVAVLKRGEAVLLPLSLVHPPLAAFMIGRWAPPADPPAVGAVTSATALTLLAALPVAASLWAAYSVVLGAAATASRSRFAQASADVLGSLAARRAPVLAQAFRDVFLTETTDGPPAPPPLAVPDAWILGRDWRASLRTQLRRRQKVEAADPAEVDATIAEAAAVAERDGNNADGESAAESKARLRLVSAYIITRLAEEGAVRSDAIPASARPAVDVAVGAVTAATTVVRASLGSIRDCWRRSGTAAPADEDASTRNGPISAFAWSRPIAPALGAVDDDAATPESGQPDGEDAAPQQDDSTALARLREEYTAASSALALEWAEGARADDATLVALVDQLAEDIAAVLAGTQAAGNADGDNNDEESSGEDAGPRAPLWSPQEQRSWEGPSSSVRRRRAF
jgi:hypothetical protein